MNTSKICWAIRYYVYSIRAQFGLPGYIGKPNYISRIGGLRTGKRVRIYPGLRAEIGTEDAAVIIGDNTSIGQNFHVVAYSEPVVIGKDVTISGNVFVSNCDHDYRTLGVHVLEQNVNEAKTCIGDNCFLGYGSVILAGTILGRQCVVGANSVVRGVFPDYCVIAGNPARIIRKYNEATKTWERV